MHVPVPRHSWCIDNNNDRALINILWGAHQWSNGSIVWRFDSPTLLCTTEKNENLMLMLCESICTAHIPVFQCFLR